MKLARAAGFSLIELVIAIVILSLMLTGIFTLYGRGQNAVGRAEILTTAAFLARAKMGEVTLDLEKRAAENKFPETDEHQEGEFEGDYARFRYRIEIARIKMPQLPANLGAGDDEGGGPAAAGNPMQLLLQQLKLDDLIREVTLKVMWDEHGRERSIQVATHIVKL